MAEEWMIKDGKFTFPKRDKGKFAARKGKKNGTEPAVSGPSFDAAERKLQPKKSGKSFGKPR